jgi:hypothetical protein
MYNREPAIYLRSEVWSIKKVCESPKFALAKKRIAVNGKIINFEKI